MLDDTATYPMRVSDLKQWAYCPRVWYYHHCLPNVRPITYKMQHGIEAGLHTEELEQRRSLRLYGLTRGERTFNVALASARLGLRGAADMVIDTDEASEGGERELIPVDFKESKIGGDHFKLQVAAYGMMLEEMRGIPVRRRFLYLIPLRRAETFAIDKRLRKKVEAALVGMKRVMTHETMPEPTPNLSKCVACEFRRFCNDVM